MSTAQQHTRRTWIDMTDLVSWRGHFTGTQRVAYEVAKRFNQNQSQQPAAPKTAFFVYDEGTQSFYEVSFETIESRVNPRPQSADPVAKPRFHRPSVKNVIRAQSIRAYHSLPYSVKQKITPERKALVKAAYHKLNTATRVVRPTHNGAIKLAIPNAPALHFSADDTVVLLGKPWDTMSLIDVLRRQKLESGFKLVNLIYDMIPVHMPHLFGKPLPTDYTSYMFEAVSLSDQIVAISENTKKDTIRFCKDQLLPVPPITVTKLGNTFVSGISEDITDVSGLSGREFILCVGTVENRKNHILLYTAYRQAALEGIELPELVIVGGVGSYTTDVLYEFANDPVMSKRVHVRHRTNDQELDWLYNHCIFTVYPSVYEGWGLPIAESLAYGKVCIASNTSSMTEIAGDLIDYFSPYDSVGCLKLIQKYTDPKLRAAKEKDIRKHYKLVSWDEPYEQIFKAIQATS